MVKVEKVLQCDICHNNFDMNTHRPLVAKCGHTFCKHCILCKNKNIICSSCPIDNIQYVLNIESCIPNIKLEEVIKIIFNIDSPKLEQKQIVYSKPEILRNKATSKTKKLSINEESFQEKVISLDKNKMKISNQNKFSTEYKFVHTEPMLFTNSNTNLLTNKICFDDEKINNDNINETLDAIPINEEKSILNVSFKDEMNSLFRKNYDKKNSSRLSKNLQSKDTLKDDINNDMNDSLDKISKIDDEFLTINNTNNDDISLLSNKNLVNVLQTKTISNDNDNNNYCKEKLDKYKKYTKNINLNVIKRNNSSKDNIKKISCNSDRDTDANSNGIKEKSDNSPNNKLQNIKISLINNNENLKIESNYKTIDDNNNDKIGINIFKSQQIIKEKEKIDNNEDNVKQIFISNQKLNPTSTLYKHHLVTSQSTKTGNTLLRSYTSNQNLPLNNNNLNKYSTNTLNLKKAFPIENIDEEYNDDEIIENNNDTTEINMNNNNIIDNKITNKNIITAIKSKPRLENISRKNSDEYEIKEKNKIILQKYVHTPKDGKIIGIRFPNQIKIKPNSKEEIIQKLKNEILYFLGFNGTPLSKRKIEKTLLYQKYIEYINNSLNKKIFDENYINIQIKVFPNNDIFIGYINENNLPKKGVFYYNNGDYYEGDLMNGIREGYGYMKLKNGTIYEGDFKNNKHDGYGKLTQIDGEIFSGEWKEGKIEGKGVRHHNNGDKYIGNYVNNLKEGNGKYFFSNGNVYEGNWENGKANGFGKFIFHDGNIYEGEFKDNIIFGKGNFIMKNGDKYIGFFKNGFINGKGICENNKGEKYSGFFSNGKKHGIGKLVDRKGNVIANGLWNMDKFVGKVNNNNEEFL